MELFLFPKFQVKLFSIFGSDSVIFYFFNDFSIKKLCPALALILSITQALSIHVCITDSIFQIKFLLTKLLSTLLEINKPGRYPIEQYFECEFFNDDDIVVSSAYRTYC